MSVYVCGLGNLIICTDLGIQRFVRVRDGKAQYSGGKLCNCYMMPDNVAETNFHQAKPSSRVTFG